MTEQQETTQTFSFKRMAVFSGTSFGVVMALVTSVMIQNVLGGLAVGIFTGLFFGLVFTWVMARFTRRQTLWFQTNPPDFGTEKVLLEGPANHFMGKEGVGGYLWLTNGRLHYCSHQRNFQNHEWETELSEIAAAELTKTMKIFDNGLLIRLNSGDEEHFVVNANQLWLSAIERATS